MKAVLFSLLASIAAQSDPLVVSTNVGTFQGAYASDSVRSWLGIRFAKPTNGTRRFRPPQRADILPAGQIYNATQYSPACGQVSGQQNRTTSDDCLSLNIWAPTNSSNTTLTPVLLWIYGGGFVGGANSIPLYTGTNFVQNQGNLTVVSINYRLAAFGFPAGSGLGPLELNPGLLDQRLAIEWVYNNIREFGGDPEQITLFGESAGAESIGSYQFAYPYDPIVKGFIQESGSEFLLAGTQASYNANSTNTAWQTFANNTGCGLNSTTTQAQQFTCMQNADFATIQSALSRSAGATRFLPTVDDLLIFNSSEYLRKERAGEFARLPVLIGTNNNEGTTLVGSYAAQSGGSDFAVNLITTYSFTCPAAQVALSRTNYSIPVWQYRYFGTWPNITPPNSTLGAFHGSEIAMVFGTYNQSTSYPVSAAEVQTSQIMQSAWTAFARNPTSGLTEFGWPVYQGNGTTLIQIARNYYNVSADVLAQNLSIITYNDSRAFSSECSSGYPDVQALPGSTSMRRRRRQVKLY